MQLPAFFAWGNVMCYIFKAVVIKLPQPMQHVKILTEMTPTQYYSFFFFFSKASRYERNHSENCARMIYFNFKLRLK